MFMCHPSRFGKSSLRNCKNQSDLCPNKDTRSARYEVNFLRVKQAAVHS